MKIYVLADMEGIGGIRLMEQVFKHHPDSYAEGRRLMTSEINLCVDELSRQGVTDILVADTHGGGGQLNLSEMDPRATYELPFGHHIMPGLDDSFDGVILLGHHARAGTQNAFLDHTFSSASIFEYRLNGRVYGEIGIEAAYAAHYGVPVILCSGDAAMAAEACADLGNVTCAVLKWSIGRNRARCLPVAQAHETLRSAIRNAIANIAAYQPLEVSLPATIEKTFYRTDHADEAADHPDVERVDGRTVRRHIGSLLDVRRW